MKTIVIATVLLLAVAAGPTAVSAKPGRAPLTLDAVQSNEVERVMELVDTPAERFLDGSPPPSVTDGPQGTPVTWIGVARGATRSGFVLEVGGGRILVETGGPRPRRGDDVRVHGWLMVKDGLVRGLRLQSLRRLDPPVTRPTGLRVATHFPRGRLASRMRWYGDEPERVSPGTLAAWILGYNPRVGAARAGQLASWIRSLSRGNGVDPRLVTALVAAESAFQPTAVSKVGAMGLGQLMPGTAAGLGVNDPYDPRQNLEGTVRYLATQLRRWRNADDPVALALASYNAGPDAVRRFGGVPPYPETVNYVRYVSRLYRELTVTPPAGSGRVGSR